MTWLKLTMRKSTSTKVLGELVLTQIHLVYTAKIAAYNYTRFTSEKNDELLTAGTSEKAFDTEYRKDIYNQWQELMVDEVPVAPTVYRYKLWATNKRVVNYSIDPASPIQLYELGVTEAKPVVE